MTYDPFGAYFERDYLSVGELARMYGVGRDVSLRISQFGVRETVRRGGQRGQAMKEEKPVVWFVEHPGKPVYLSRSAHETLLDRFGDRYWLNERRGDILYAPQKIRVEDNPGGRDEARFMLVFVRGPYHDHRAPLGQDYADKVLAAVEPLGWTREKFRTWLRQQHPDLVAINDAAESLAAMPRLMAHPLDEWRREAKSDTSRAGQPPTPPAPDPAATPPSHPPHDHGGHASGFLPPSETGIVPDDIPF